MNLVVRRASLTNDRQEILDILNRNFGTNQASRFEWRHTANPAGQSWTWFVYERSTNATVAMASVFPRYIYVNGKLMICGQVGEFAVEPGYRSLGPAVLMQRATFDPVNTGALAMCYDCPPHDQGMSTFKRLGMRANTEVFRYALLLRSDEFLQKRLGTSVFIKPAIAAANLILKVKRPSRRMRGIEVSAFDEDFGEEFTHLDQMVSSSGVIRASRSAELLNWRYRSQPRAQFRVFVARRARELLGFLVIKDYGGRVTIADLFGRELVEIAVALLDAVVITGRRERIHLLEGYSSEGNLTKLAFLKVGFSCRESLARVIAYEKPDCQPGKMLGNGLRWAFSQVETSLGSD